jgi:hypothetical protein
MSPGVKDVMAMNARTTIEAIERDVGNVIVTPASLNRRLRWYE